MKQSRGEQRQPPSKSAITNCCESTAHHDRIASVFMAHGGATTLFATEADLFIGGDPSGGALKRPLELGGDPYG